MGPASKSDDHTATATLLPEPVIVPRSEHSISRKQFSPNAVKVLYRLKDAGFEAYLVGGCIRDILLGLEPKDFDVVTNAKPEEIKRIFRNCRLIGRRFRLAHIVFGQEIIEVATMRGHHSDEGKSNNISQASEHGQLLRDNVYGTIEEDAERRDFSINALYYSIEDFSIRDYAGGLAAIRARQIELIGDPETRYREDPVRMLRAVRFATKLDMGIAPATKNPIPQLASLLENIPAARLFEECLKLFLNGKAEQNFLMLRELGLFKYLFPTTERALNASTDGFAERFIQQMFANTDARINADKKVTPAFIFAALLWLPLRQRAEALVEKDGMFAHDAYNIAMNAVLSDSAKQVAVPKRFTIGARDIWHLQLRLDKRGGQRAYRLSLQPKFRAAYDFLLLRVESGETELQSLAAWWTNYLEKDVTGQKDMVKSLDERSGPRRPRRRKPRKKPDPS
ncbi:polynucleotide adenylyltransferase PcnB [Pseudoalteromonas xiamenensis]|uniref:polynucleotide adenylyltransferase PcnB n=1 Tax=Pseudoalteromonas xiamenensis TaxID=882626 RepID=UPI00355C7324